MEYLFKEEKEKEEQEESLNNKDAYAYYAKFQKQNDNNILAIFYESLQKAGLLTTKENDIKLAKYINSIILKRCYKYRVLTRDLFPDIYNISLVLMNKRIIAYRSKDSHFKDYIKHISYLVVRSAIDEAMNVFKQIGAEKKDIRKLEVKSVINPKTGEEVSIFEAGMIYYLEHRYESDNMIRIFLYECIKEHLKADNKRQMIVFILKTLCKTMKYNYSSLARKYKVCPQTIINWCEKVKKMMNNCITRKVKEVVGHGEA